MKLAMVLTAVLMLAACGSAESGGGTASVQGVSGTYTVEYVVVNGDHKMTTVQFDNGRLEVRSYIFPQGDTSKGQFSRKVGTYSVSGKTYVTNYPPTSCMSVLPISFEVLAETDDGLLVHFDKEDQSMLLRRIQSLDQYQAQETPCTDI